MLLKIDYRWKMARAKMVLVGRPPLSRLRRRFTPLRGAQRRYAALRAAPLGRYAPRALRAHHFSQHEKNAGGGGNSELCKVPRTTAEVPRTTLKCPGPAADGRARLGVKSKAAHSRLSRPLSSDFRRCRSSSHMSGAAWRRHTRSKKRRCDAAHTRASSHAPCALRRASDVLRASVA